MQTHFINVCKSHLQCGTQRQSWRAATLCSNMFCGLQFFFLQFNYINRNVSYNVISDLQSWLSGQSVALNSERLPVLIQAVCFCPIGLCAPTLFKSSETKPALTRRRGGLPPRDNSYFQFAAWTGTTVYKGGTLVLLTGRAFFCQSPVASTWP